MSFYILYLPFRFLQWVDYDGMQWMPVKDEKIANEIKEMGQKVKKKNFEKRTYKKNKKCIPNHKKSCFLTYLRFFFLLPQMFLALNGDSYARCDIRMDKQGRIFFLEINPYCGIFYAPETPGSADCILQYDSVGKTEEKNRRREEEREDLRRVREEKGEEEEEEEKKRSRSRRERSIEEKKGESKKKQNRSH